MSERGKVIVFEGSDGTGKTEQAVRNTDYFESLGIPMLRVWNDEVGAMQPVQEPGGTPYANKIRIQLKTDASLSPWEQVVKFTDAREDIYNNVTLPALEAGVSSIPTRNFISTVMYQGRVLGIEAERILDYTRERMGEDYMTPELTCILALYDESVRRERARQSAAHEKDVFEMLPESDQVSLQVGYVKYAEENELPLIDAGGTRDEVELALRKLVEPILLPLQQ